MSPLTSERGQEMLGYLPGLYQDSVVTQDLLQAEGTEFDALRQALDEIVNQFFARTATWALDRWEQELGLVTDTSQTDSERQDRIVSRIRGTGTATISVVQSVAESYDKGAIDISEEFGSYSLTVYFVNTTGVPPNLGDLKAAVRSVVPAHLDITYRFNYFRWDQLDAMDDTWDQFDALGLTWDELAVYQP